MMSHNTDPPARSARRYRPALLAIGVALGMAFLALMVGSVSTPRDPVGVVAPPNVAAPADPPPAAPAPSVRAP